MRYVTEINKLIANNKHYYNKQQETIKLVSNDCLEPYHIFVFSAYYNAKGASYYIVCDVSEMNTII